MSDPRCSLVGDNISEGSSTYSSSSEDTSRRKIPIQIEPNAFGGLAVALHGEMLHCASRCHMCLLVIMALTLQVAFAAFMIPEISKDEYIGKTKEQIVEVLPPEIGQRVCALTENLVDINNPVNRIKNGTCGRVVAIESGGHDSNRIYFQFDNGAFSSTHAYGWSRIVEPTDMSALRTVTTDGVFKSWELGDGAKIYGNRTLAAWTCTGLDWSWHEAKADELTKYMQPILWLPQFPHGLVFATAALFLWSAVIIKAFRQLFGFLALVSPHLKIDWRATPEDEEEPDVFGICGKTCLVVVSFSRFLVLSTLAFFGMKFLCHTDNLKDFILNSVALGFVIEVPQLLFDAFASMAEIDATTKFQAKYELYYVRVSPCMWYGVGPLMLLLALAMVFVGLEAYLIPFAIRLLEIYDTLCPDQKLWREMLAET